MPDHEGAHVHTTGQQITRAAAQPEPNRAQPPGVHWWTMLSPRSKALGLIALVTRVMLMALSWANAEVRERGPLLALLILTTVTSAFAVISIVVDAIRTRPQAAYWTGYVHGRVDERDATPFAAVIDLNDRREQQATQDAARRERRYRTAVLVVIALLLLGLTADGLWNATGSDPGDSPILVPPVASALPSASSGSTGSTVGGTPNPGGTPPGGRPPTAQPTQPGVPAPTPASPAGPSPVVVVAANAPSTDPLTDGSYTAGDDIASGAWSTGGAVNLSLGCRYSINGGTPVRILLAVGPRTVQLHDGDTFTTAGCADWRYAT